MIRFEENKLVIEIETLYPAGTLINLHRGICDIVRNVCDETIVNDTFYAVIDFTEELFPCWEDLKRLQK
jgi:hypothetical protein